MYIIHLHFINGVASTITLCANCLEEVLDYIRRNNLVYDFITEPTAEVIL